MRIVNFSNDAAQPFLIAPVHILAPWVVRLKSTLSSFKDANSPGHSIRSPKSARDLEKPRPVSGTPIDPGTLSKAAVPRSGLRIVREFDSAVSADCAGRMVISGRMADVCAELDRMASRGTAAH